MKKGKKFKKRSMKNGNWYWIEKALIQKTPKVRAIGILVYNFLASLADKRGSCFPSQKYMAKCLEYSRTTINRAIKSLEKNNLVRIKRRGRSHLIYYLCKLRCKVGETKMSHRQNQDVAHMDTNNTKLTRNINNIDKRDFLNSSFNEFTPKTKSELLAVDVAKELSDIKNLSLYLHYCKKYPEPFIRKILGEVKEVRPEKIKKNRAALFFYLLKKYDENKRAS